MMIEKILIPIDGSEPSIKALDYALDLAEALDAEVVLLSVVPPIVLPITPEEEGVTPIVTPMQVDRYTQRLKEIYENALNEGIKRAQSKKPDLKISARLAEGRPWDRIVTIAEDEKFDLIVMGSRGLSGLREFFLGSVTHRVADNCKCPILIIK